MAMFVATVIYLVLGWVATRCIYRGYLHPLAKYPGPFVARFTNLWRFVTYIQKHGHIIDEQLHAQYGPIVRTGPDSLSFSSLAAYHTIYTVDKVFEKGAFYDFAREAATGRNGVFATRTAAEHRDARRRVMNGAFSRPSHAGYRSVIAAAVSQLVRSIEDEAQRQAESCVDIAPLVQNFATDLTFELVHGLSLADLPAHSREAALQDFKVISKFSFGAAYLPFLGYILESRLGQAFVQKTKLDPVTKEPLGFSALATRSRDAVLHRDAEISAPNAQPSLLKSWLSVNEDDTSKYMDKPQIARESLNLLFAGRGSIAVAIVLVLHVLGTEKGKPWQRKIREELSVQGGHQTMPPSFLAVTKETLRLDPPFPRGFPREVGTLAEVVMPGMDHPLPPRTLVYSSSYVLGRSTDVWGDDAAEWKPERWLTEANKAGAEGPGSDLGSLESRFLVFGGKGPRSCLGRDLAMMTIFETVSQVLERWEIVAEGAIHGAIDWEIRYDNCPMTFEQRQVVES